MADSPGEWEPGKALSAGCEWGAQLRRLSEGGFLLGAVNGQDPASLLSVLRGTSCVLREEGPGFLPGCVIEDGPQKQSMLRRVSDADLPREKTGRQLVLHGILCVCVGGELPIRRS